MLRAHTGAAVRTSEVSPADAVHGVTKRHLAAVVGAPVVGRAVGAAVGATETGLDDVGAAVGATETGMDDVGAAVGLAEDGTGVGALLPGRVKGEI